LKFQQENCNTSDAVSIKKTNDGEGSQRVALFVLTLPGIWDRTDNADVTLYVCSCYERGI
jgi:hypothetical protein